jgi:hypothetical protein
VAVPSLLVHCGKLAFPALLALLALLALSINATPDLVS